MKHQSEVRPEAVMMEALGIDLDELFGGDGVELARAPSHGYSGSSAATGGQLCTPEQVPACSSYVDQVGSRSVLIRRLCVGPSAGGPPEFVCYRWLCLVEAQWYLVGTPSAWLIRYSGL